MRHEKRFFTFSLCAALIGLIFSACQTSMPLSKWSNFPEVSFQSIAQASTGSSRANNMFLVSEGKASYYANQFHGRKTANGETFNMNEFTAAHPSLPFGTWVRVTNLRNGKDVIVRINDRGPFIKGRVIDLSVGAAKQIGLFKSGTAQVRVEAIEKTSSEVYSG